MKKYSKFLVLAVFVLSVILIVASPKIKTTKSSNYVLYEKSKVLKVQDEELQKDILFSNINNGYQNIEIEILSGKFKGEKYNIKNNLSRMYNVQVHEGMKVITAFYFQDDKLVDISIYSHKRDNVLYSLLAIFFICIILIGGRKGVKSIISLIFTAIMIIFYMLPQIFNGGNAIVAAIVTAVVTTIVTLLLIGGLSKKTMSAMIGTILGVIFAGVIAYIAGRLSHLSGLTLQDADSLIYIADKYHINIQGIMFVSILIASVGAIMDVGMSIASSIFEMHKLNPEVSPKALFTSGMNVGKDVIGTMSNTLILAFAGSSLNLIIFIYAAQMPLTQLVNVDVLNTELIQSIAGSIGIILTVPITAFISVMLIGNKEITTKKQLKVKNKK